MFVCIDNIFENFSTCDFAVFCFFFVVFVVVIDDNQTVFLKIKYRKKKMNVKHMETKSKLIANRHKNEARNNAYIRNWIDYSLYCRQILGVGFFSKKKTENIFLFAIHISIAKFAHQSVSCLQDKCKCPLSLFFFRIYWINFVCIRPRVETLFLLHFY